VSGQSGACIDRFRVLLCNSTDDPHLFLLLLLLLFSIVKMEPTRVGKERWTVDGKPQNPTVDGGVGGSTDVLHMEQTRRSSATFFVLIVI
jgi:hypothetical protein